jgi:hypothetical protein
MPQERHIASPDIFLAVIHEERWVGREMQAYEKNKSMQY